MDNFKRVAFSSSRAEAFLAHPFTRHEIRRYPGNHRRHEAALKDFRLLAGLDLLRDLSQWSVRRVAFES